MVHDFKIKLAQATQEKVEALMRAASVTQEAQQQMQQAAAAAAGGNSSGGTAGGGAGGGGGYASSSIPILQRIGSTLSASARERSEAAAQHSRRASRDAGVLSRSPSRWWQLPVDYDCMTMTASMLVICEVLRVCDGIMIHMSHLPTSLT